MSDTFCACLNGTYSNLEIGRIQFMIGLEFQLAANFQLDLDFLQNLLDSVGLDDATLAKAQECALQAFLDRIEEIRAAFDTSNPSGAPHFVEFGTDFPQSGQFTPTDFEDFEIKSDALGNPVVWTGVNGDSTLGLNRDRWNFFVDARDNIFYGTLKKLNGLTLGAAFVSGEKASIQGRIDKWKACGF